MIQNLNTSFSKGLFIAGVTNTTGINNKKHEENKDFKNLEANLEGIQISGLLNHVVDNSFGSQISGGINITNGGFNGIQLAGVANVVNKYTFGVQISGVSNISLQSINGFQISTVFNLTKGQLEGFQGGIFNRAETIHGKNSYEIKAPTGVQFGLINTGGVMNGFQIGLINIGKTMQGTQIGLINLAGRGSTHLTRDGTTIGLLTIGSAFFLNSYIDEKLNINYVLGTGTFKNGRMMEKFNKYFFSTISFAKNPIFHQKENWMAGFGVFKMWAPKSITRGEYFYSSPGIQIFHYNPVEEFIGEFNPLLRIRYMYGREIFKKRGIYLFGSLTGNALFKKYDITENNVSVTNSFKAWPGLQFGITLKN